MPTSCTFELDRFNPVYSSGECINGRIYLRTGKVKRVNAVYVTLEGEAKVHWSLSGKSETANYYGYQQYLHTRVNVFDNTEFQAGMHVYSLTLRIPPDCPSSIKGPHGYIAYYISLTIDKPWTFDEVFRKPIEVVQTLDLNFNPEFALPIKDENVKYLCNWPCTSGPICSTLVLPFTGYTPEQEIPYFLEVDNQSPHYDVIGVDAALKQHFIFLTRKPIKRNFYTKTLARGSIDERTLRLTKRLYEGTVRVPERTPRSTLNPNFIVFLHYTLQLKLRTGCLHYDADISVPVVIGTVPLQQQNVLVTAQPTVRAGRQSPRRDRRRGGHRRQQRLNPSSVTVVESSIETTERTGEESTKTDDEPPTYDSCLPPSFSYATLSSQQHLESSESSLNQERRRIYIDLPKFPGYNTFTSAAVIPAMNMSAETVFADNYREYVAARNYHSADSLDTDHTGRSLDTFASSYGVLSECDDENAPEQGDDSV